MIMKVKISVKYLYLQYNLIIVCFEIEYIHFLPRHAYSYSEIENSSFSTGARERCNKIYHCIKMIIFSGRKQEFPSQRHDIYPANTSCVHLSSLRPAMTHWWQIKITVSVASNSCRERSGFTSAETTTYIWDVLFSLITIPVSALGRTFLVAAVCCIANMNRLCVSLTLSFLGTAIAVVKVGHSNLRPGSKGALLLKNNTG